MESTLEELEGNKIKLSVQVDADEIDKAVDAAARKLAREVRMPGFRPGKVPRRVLEARMGQGALRQEALRESLPDYYAEAVREHDADVIAAPEIEITEGEDSGDLKFDAVVEVRPHVQIPGYAGLQVTLERPEATDEDIDRQIDRLRANGATLDEVSRPAKDGDVLTIDLSMTAGSDEPNTLTDVSYTLGSGEFGIDELDTQLQGVRVGDIIKFTAHPSEERYISVQVLVKAVKAQVLPDLTDEWVASESEFETVQELREDLRNRITAVKKVQAQLAFRDLALGALAELVTEDAPAPLVEAEVERRVHDLGHRLEGQGATFEQYFAAIGQEPEQFLEELRTGAVPAVKADLALRALADAEELEVTEEDIDAEIVRLAEALDQPPATVRRSLVNGDRLPAVRSDLRKGKALAWLLEHVDVVDPEGTPIDRAELQAPPAAGDDGNGEDASVEESAE